MIEFKPELVEAWVYRSRQPRTAQDFEAIKSLGIKRVIDLENERGEGPWETEVAKSYGIEVINIPMSGFWAPSPFQISQVLYQLSAATMDFPVLFHCAHGEDRTGLIAGIWQRMCGTAIDAAWAYMLATGFHPFLFGLSWAFWTYR